MTNLPLVIEFKDIDKNDLSLVGGKGANLGEMTKAGFPVPNGFAVTVPAYEMFLRESGLTKTIYEILKTIDVEDANQLEDASKKIQKLINISKFPELVFKDMVREYKKLAPRKFGLPYGKALVAVRSSATAEDLPGMSFAGQQATFLNIKGESALMVAVRECWASLFTPRAIYYRHSNNIKIEKVGISVIVQKMVQSEVSGIMFSIDPVTNRKDRIIIDAVWGLGEMIVQGSYIPDHYVVQKETFSILSKELNDQKMQYIKDGQITREVKVPEKNIARIKLSDEQIIYLAKLSQKLHDHYYYPQDSEWALEKGKLYLVQTRPITTIEKTTKVTGAIKNNESQATAPILKGISASPGMGTGVVKILKSPKEIDKIKAGDVLVAPMTSPDYVPAMKKASAIVTNEGGMTSHAAIVSREMGIPCVVGTKTGTTTLKEGDVVTVNGVTGEIFAGATKLSKESKTDDNKENKKNTTYKTATKLYVNLAEPDRAKEVSKMDVDGIGLLRAEFMIADIGIHPKEAIKRHTQHLFVDKMIKKLTTFCENFSPRQVVYRATDFKTNEYRSLDGGKNWEPQESNPMLGYRGAYRYISDPEVFALELRAIKEVRKKYPHLQIMIPFVRSPEELRRVRKIVQAEGLFDDPYFKFWMMVEIPVNVIMIEEFIKVGIDGISIGSNDLTMLLQGTDRDNSTVATEFNEMSPEVLWAIKKVIKTCNKYGVTSSICGQAASTYNDMIEVLVHAGITSISVNPDAVSRVRNMIHDAEKALVIKNRK